MPRVPAMPIVSAVETVIRRRALVPAGTRVAVAVSGGSDSVALFRLLLALEAPLGFSVAGLIHVNHQLRGVEADADERFCRALAEAHGRAAHVERVTVSRHDGTGRRR